MVLIRSGALAHRFPYIDTKGPGPEIRGPPIIVEYK